MASSSAAATSSQCPRRTYDVFLSFRGEESRKTFTSHLFESLKNRGIFTFQDDERLEHGTLISEQLLKAIQESQVAVIIFSKNYASSRWCLDELVKIMKCRDEHGQTVIPVFYDVDPSTIRYQRESFAEAFATHESNFKDDVEGTQKMLEWRSALTAAANLRGYDIRQGIESKNIQEIVKQISSILCQTASLSSLKDLVGIDIHLEKVKALLELEINDVRIVGIWGMGGVGKTTIARAIFDTSSYKFDAACFLADVKENEKRHQLHSLQNILLSQILRKKDDYISDKYDGKHMISRRLCSKKVLIVLDDIDHIDHLEYLAGDLGWFGNGSRVIVTTRDSHLIEKDNAIYEVATLPNHEAMLLFNRHAFKREVPDERFKKLSLEVASHAKGLPLALKVWGSFLHKKDVTEWRSAIEQMKSTSNSEIVDKLKISYDGLELVQQEIFLDIACFLRGSEKKVVLKTLESCDFRADIGLRILIDKSLVFISEKDTVEMHDLIQDMGKYIVNMQKDPGERSRIWLVEDFEEVMINNSGTKVMEVIWFHYRNKLYLSKEAMNNMKRLRILNVCKEEGYRCFSDASSCHNGSIEYLPNSLRWLALEQYPCESLPAHFNPKRLFHLELRDSLLRHLSTETMHLSALRTLNLYCSKCLIQSPDFTGMPNLEYLDMQLCINLEEIHDSLGNCRKLIRLSFSECVRLKSFPCVNVESLEYLNLVKCSRLEKFPEIRGRMKLELVMAMGYSGIRELPSSIQYQTHLTKLVLQSIDKLVALPSCICRLKSLVSLDVSFCSKLESLPEEIGNLENLEQLYATFNQISRPPSSIVCLNKLKILSFRKDKYSYQVPDCFVFPQVNGQLHSLQELNLNYCKLSDGGLPEDIGCLSTLQLLHLRGSNLTCFPRSVTQLGALRSLDISDCKRLNVLPELSPNIEKLSADFEMVLRSILSLATKYKNLQRVLFTSERTQEVVFKIDDDDDFDVHDEYDLMFAQSPFQCVGSTQCIFSALDSLSQRVIFMVHPGTFIPKWIPLLRKNVRSPTVHLPGNWYVNSNFLGVAICCYGFFNEITIKFLPLRYAHRKRENLLVKRLSSSYPSTAYYNRMHFIFIPIVSLWNTFKENGATPNDYGDLVVFTGQIPGFGYRLLYRHELPDEEHCFIMGLRSSRYGNCQHLDATTSETCSTSNKRKSPSFGICENFPENLRQQVEELCALHFVPECVNWEIERD